MPKEIQKQTYHKAVSAFSISFFHLGDCELFPIKVYIPFYFNDLIQE